MRKTRSQIRAEQIAQLQAEQAEHEKNVEAAMKVAKYSRCAVVEELYELLDVRSEQRPRESKNGVIQVSTDKDESKRTARLLDAVTRLLVTREDSSGSTADWGRGAPVPDDTAEPDWAAATLLPTG
ncbi:hypothetical protein [Microbacterium sp.]|uniref:hypothetical protein n=1 Tax=Microbacterium sp. TaxID=51671 RepID=UPI002734E2F7|nr:hypothetical protein [Microbacterium sp.]MDP3949507.1 hypothetical protein [Microbacterium sp.]